VNEIWWVGLGVLVALLSFWTQKWSVEHVQPGQIKLKRGYFVSAFVLRQLLAAAVLFLALGNGFIAMAYCASGMIIGKWGLVFFWLWLTKRLE